MVDIEEKVFSGMVLGVVLVFTILGASYNSIARVAPLVVGIPGILIAMVLFTASLRKKKGESERREGNIKSILIVWLWMFLYIVLIGSVGFYTATFVFVVAFSLFFSKYTLRRSFVFGGIAAFAAYIIFSVLLKFPLPRGVLELWSIIS